MADNKENNAPVTTQEVEEFSFSLPTEEEIKQILDAREEEKADEKDMMKTLQQQERELTELTANMRKQLDEQMVYLRMRAGNITAGSVSLEQAEVDGRSVHVANVDYSAKVAELEQCFKECGQIKRITIPVDKFSGRPKGFAYVEFVDKASAQKAVALTGSQLRGRAITVVPKRSNVPGMSTTTRGRGGRGAYRGGNAANSRGGFVASRGNSRGGFVASRGGYSTTSRGGYATSSRGAAAMHLPSSLFKGLGGKGAKGGFVKNVRYVPY